MQSGTVSVATPALPSIDSSTSGQPYTILRIKRKRNEEPLDALVVESLRRKKSRGLGVFQYAETVEADAWDDVQRQKDIKDKISRLAKGTVVKPDVTGSSTSMPPPAPPSPPVTRPSKEEMTRRYTIVEADTPDVPVRRYPISPPKIISSKDLEQEQAAQATKNFKMYDAVPSAAQTPMVQDSPSDMDKFLPMLNDYLKIHDIDPSMDVRPKDPNVSGDSAGSDYVWDVFYHRPVTLSEWNAAAANVGTLTGLPANFEGYDSDDSDDEFLDEADEDSNAEEYYKNDYPEEEEDNSDEFFEDSDYGDGEDFHDAQDDLDSE